MEEAPGPGFNPPRRRLLRLRSFLACCCLLRAVTGKVRNVNFSVLAPGKLIAMRTLRSRAFIKDTVAGTRERCVTLRSRTPR